MRTFKKMKFFIYTLFFLSLPAILSVPSATAAFRYLHEGMKMPEVVGVDVATGEEISSEQFRKNENILVIVFWASWSKRSIEELVALKEIANDYSDKPVKIIAVNVENANLSGQKAEHIKQLFIQLDLPFPSIIDKNFELFNSFGVIAVPSTAITDSSGLIKFGPAGYSLTTRDLIIDSLMVLLGLKDKADSISVRDGYTPKNKSLRYYNLALNLRLQGLYKRALSNLQTAQEADPKFPAPYSLRGEIFILLQQPENALTEYTIALSLDSQFVAAQAGLGQALFLTDKSDEAIIQLKSLLTKDDTFTPAIITLSQCYMKQNNIQDALSLLTNIMELNPNDPTLLYNLGKLHKLNQERDKAINSYQKALKALFPNK